MNNLTILRASLKSIQAGITPQSYQRVIDVVQANRLAADLVEWVKAAKPACIENILVLIDELEKEVESLKAQAVSAPVSEATTASLVDIRSDANSTRINGNEPESLESAATTGTDATTGNKPEKATNKRSRSEAAETVEDFKG